MEAPILTKVFDLWHVYQLSIEITSTIQAETCVYGTTSFDLCLFIFSCGTPISSITIKGNFKAVLNFFRVKVFAIDFCVEKLIATLPFDSTYLHRYIFQSDCGFLNFNFWIYLLLIIICNSLSCVPHKILNIINSRDWSNKSKNIFLILLIELLLGLNYLWNVINIAISCSKLKKRGVTIKHGVYGRWIRHGQRENGGLGIKWLELDEGWVCMNHECGLHTTQRADFSSERNNNLTSAHCSKVAESGVFF